MLEVRGLGWRTLQELLPFHPYLLLHISYMLIFVDSGRVYRRSSIYITQTHEMPAFKKESVSVREREFCCQRAVTLFSKSRTRMLHQLHFMQEGLRHDTHTYPYLLRLDVATTVSARSRPAVKC